MDPQGQIFKILITVEIDELVPFLELLNLYSSHRKEEIFVTNMQVQWLSADEQRRHNLASEAETHRHYAEQERLTGIQNELTERQIAELERSHKMSEALSAAQLSATIQHQQNQDAETMRSNLASEDIIRAHNKATESIARAENRVKSTLGKENVKVAYSQQTLTRQIADADRAMQSYFKQVAADQTAAINQAQIQKWERDWKQNVMAAQRDAERLEVEKAYQADSAKTNKTVRFKNVSEGIGALTKAADTIFKDVESLRKPSSNPIGFGR